MSKLYLCNQNKDDFKSVWIFLFHEDPASVGPTLDAITQQPFCLSGVLVDSVFYFGNRQSSAASRSCLACQQNAVFLIFHKRL